MSNRIVYNTKNRPKIRSVTRRSPIDPIDQKSKERPVLGPLLTKKRSDSRKRIPPVTTRSRIINGPKNLVKGYPIIIPPSPSASFNFQNGTAFGIHRDANLTSITTTRDLRLPYLNSNNLPPPLVPPVGGGLSYDTNNKLIYYSDGKTWLPIISNNTKIESYSFTIEENQTVPTGVPVTISDYDDNPLLGYHSLLEWDLPTGLYTAVVDVTITAGVNISWEQDISNLGERYVRIVRVDNTNFITAVIAEGVTQADPNVGVETTQELYIHTKLLVGDQIYIEVEQNSPSDLEIKADSHTTVSGFVISSVI